MEKKYGPKAPYQPPGRAGGSYPLGHSRESIRALLAGIQARYDEITKDIKRLEKLKDEQRLLADSIKSVQEILNRYDSDDDSEPNGNGLNHVA